MADVKLYGAINGPGVQVRELPLQEGAEAAPVGTTLLVGTADAGPTAMDKVLKLLGEVDFDRQFGASIRDTNQFVNLPLHAQAFYEGARQANGATAGTLWILRVTGGEEQPAAVALWPRLMPRSVLKLAPAPHKGQPAIPEPRLLISSKYGGSGYGAAQQFTMEIPDIVAAISGSETLTAPVGGAGDALGGGVTSWEGALPGARISFPLLAPGWSAPITSLGDDPSGFQLQAGAAFPPEVLAATGAQRIAITTGTTNEAFAREEGIAVSVGSAGERDRFSFRAVRQPNGHSLRMDSVQVDGASSLSSALENQPLQEWLEADGSIGGSFDASDELELPADWAGVPMPGDYSSTKRLELRTVYWTRDQTAGAFDSYLDVVADFSHGANAVPCRIVATFTSGTAYTVEVQRAEGSENAAWRGVVHPAGALPSGTLGTEWNGTGLGMDWLPAFTLRAGSTAPVAGAKVVILALPLPAGAAERGAVLYPAAGSSEGDTGQQVRISASGPDWVELATPGTAGDLVTPPAAPQQVGTTDGSPNFTLAGGETFVITLPEGGSAVTLTESGLGAGSHSALDVATEFNAQETARTGAGQERIEFYVVDAVKVAWRLLADFGPEAVPTVGAGTLNSLVGFAAGDVAGTGGKLLRIEALTPLAFGANGKAPAPEDFEASLSWGAADPIRAMLEANTGAVGIGVPDVSQYPAIAIAAAKLAEQFGSVHVVDLPPNLTTEGEAKAWVEANLEGGSWADHRAIYYSPSAKVRPTDRAFRAVIGSTTTLNLSAHILGVIARNAVERGYAEAPAGWTKGKISPFVVDVPHGDQPLDAELLTAFGLNEIRKRGTTVALFGDRIRSYGVQEDGTRRIWLHERLAIGHIVRTCLWSLQPLIFQAVDDFGFARARQLARSIMMPFYLAGWFDSENGPTFEDQILIRSDRTNNPAAEIRKGNQAIAIGFKIKGTAERVVVSLDPNGASVSVS